MSERSSTSTGRIGMQPQVTDDSLPESAFKESGVDTVNKTADHPDVNVAVRDDFESLAAISEAMDDQETVSPDDDSVRCASGDKGFRTYLSDLPVVRREDLEAGVIVYRPVSPLPYVITDEPYETERGSHRVDARYWSTKEDENGNTVVEHVHECGLFVSAIVDEMTFVTKDEVQTTLV